MSLIRWVYLSLLAVCKSSVDLHKGSVAATSAGLGCGSSFSITLPVLTRRRATESRVVTAVTAPVASSRSFRTKPQLLKSVSKAWERSFRFLASEVSHTFGHKSVSKSRVLPVSSSDYGDKEEEEEEEGDNLRTTCANGEDNSVMSFRYVGEEDGRHTGNGTLLLSRVLIVDDVSMNRKMLRRVLERSCGAMDEAEDGMPGAAGVSASANAAKRMVQAVQQFVAMLQIHLVRAPASAPHEHVMPCCAALHKCHPDMGLGV